MMRITTDFVEQHSIDMEIAVHERAIIALKTRRNTHAAISKLPDEVLLMILLLAKPEDRGPTNKILEWLRETQIVCHQWKDLVVSSPPLWSCIYLNNQPSIQAMAATMLAHAKDAPLEVTISLSSSIETPGPQFLGLAKRTLDQIHCIRTLAVESNNSANDISALLPARAPAPLLRDLKVTGYSFKDPDRPLPLIIFDHLSDLRSLQSLELCYVRLPDKLPMLPTLRSLSITTKARQLELRLTVAWLLSTLMSTPNLYSLRIGEVAIQPMDTLQTPPIELPHLKFLRINFTGLLQSVFFDCLNIPALTSITTIFKECRQGELSAQDIKPLRNLITRLPPRDEYKVSISFPTHLTIYSVDGSTLFSMFLPYTISEQHASVCRNLFTLVSPTSMDISISVYAESVPSIPDLLSHFQRLKTISVFNEDERTSSILEALIEGPNGTAPPCPGLEYLAFPFPRVIAAYRSKRFNAAVEAIIIRRQEHNIPIKKVLVMNDGVKDWEAQFKFPELLEGVFEPKKR